MRKLVLFAFILMVMLPFVSCSNEGIHEINNSGDKFDFAFIDGYIEDKQIIFLGESSHGTKEFTEMKAELTKYLHKNHDFSILAMESGKVEIDYINKNWNDFTNEFMLEAMILEAWHTEAMLSLIQYIDLNEDIRFEGLDIIPVINNSRIRDYHLQQYLKSEIAKVDKSLADTFLSHEASSLSYLTSFIYNYDEIIEEDSVKTIISDYEDILEKMTLMDSTLFPISEYLNNRITILESYYSKNFTDDYEFETTTQENLSRRDIAMYDHLKQIIHKNPEEKIIVWAHNGHIQKNFNKVEQGDDLKTLYSPPPFILGSLVEEKLHYPSYHLGFYFNEGSVRFLNGPVHDIEPKTDDTELEYILSEYGAQHLFVDFETSKEDWVTNEVYAHDSGLFDYKLIPKEQYDGLIFLENVTAQ
ncbi:erythromycin esterase family protein [Salipaludibacillus daqingensis]|uniref:erythromycin esterase family protein n=1 Tax=Salipaludibacillus daqingensis TaxID=3041001 RepID=UPI0024766A5A|nr:erythromycin esterase family protein [Salipaludibacillus daqingensis]